jgi:hypothetical protein
MPPAPFTIHVADSVLDDLRARLARTRLPARTPGARRAAGTDPDYLQQLLGYWACGFDWRARDEPSTPSPTTAPTSTGSWSTTSTCPASASPAARRPCPCC